MPKLPPALLASLLLVFVAAGCAEATPLTPPATPAAPARVAVATGAAGVFAAFKAATGGSAWDAVASLTTEGTLATGGLSGRITTLEDARDGRTVTRYALGSVEGAEGFDGSFPWEQDPGGEVRRLDAPDAVEVSRTDVWMIRQGYFASDLGGAQVSAPRDEVDAGRSYVVLDATPRGGRAVTLWFDARTHLLVRTAMRRDSKTVTTTIDDYRDAGPVRYPFHTAQDSADPTGRVDPREHADIALARVLVNAPLGEGVFAMPKMAASARIDDPSGVTRVPFQLVNNHIYADATIDGKPVHVLVDTGGVNALGRASAARLGLATEGKLAAQGVGADQVDLSLAHASEIRLGAAVLAKPIFYVIEFGSLEATEGVASDGLVGFEMFRRFRVTIDYAAHVLILADPARFSPPVGAHVVPFDLAERIPVVAGMLDGLPLRISIDTGSRVSLTLHAPFVREHDLVKRYAAAPETVTGWGVGGASRGHPARLGTLTLGDLSIDNLAGDLSTATSGSFASPDLSANLGGGVLKRFTVSFDYDARRMYLVPNAAFDAPDLFDRSGTWLEGGSDALLIAAVMTGGPADKAGLKVGDRIVAVGAELARARSVAEWRVRLRETAAGTRLALRVTRGGVQRRVDLVLADAIPARATAR